MRKIILVFALFFVFAGCNEESKNWTIPKQIQKIHITTVLNKTHEIGLEDVVTQKIIEELVQDAQVEVVQRENASSVLVCQISKYVREPLTFDRNNVPILYRVYLVISAELQDSSDPEKKLWVERFIDYETTYSEVNLPIETENIAKERIASLIATDMFHRITEGWVNLKK